MQNVVHHKSFTDTFIVTFIILTEIINIAGTQLYRINLNFCKYFIEFCADTFIFFRSFSIVRLHLYF